MTHLDPFDFFNEPPADGDQGLLRPRMKPVNSRAVHYGWELPSSGSQRVTNWRETQNDLRRQGAGQKREGMNEQSVTSRPQARRERGTAKRDIQLPPALPMGQQQTPPH